MRNSYHFQGPDGAVLFGILVAAIVSTLLLISVLLASEKPETPELPAERHSQLFSVKTDRYVDPVITEIVAETGVPIDVLSRLIHSESSWRVHVRSCVRPDGNYDVGLAQINTEYLDYFRSEFMYGALDPLHPVDSLRFAARYLSRLHSVTGNWEAAVVAYKIGPSRVAEAPESLRRLARQIVGGVL